jgi:hypothetical protein
MTVRRVLSLPLLLVLACAEPSAVAPSGASSRPPLDENDLVGMIPAEADLVLWVDLAKLRASPWTRDSFAAVAREGAAAADSDIDLIRGVDRVVFAKVPAFRDGASLLVAEGRIERERMRRAFAQAGATETASYRGAHLLTRGDEALAFVGQRTVVSGLTVAVRAALDCNFGVARAVESESWFARMRNELGRSRAPGARVAALYVLLQPATREALLREMGEGGSLEEFGARVDLGADLDVTAIGVVRGDREARDLAGRLTERLRDARTRPIVEAFGFGNVLDGIRLEANAARVTGVVHISERERADIAQRMARVAETLATLRKREEKKNP